MEEKLAALIRPIFITHPVRLLGLLLLCAPYLHSGIEKLLDFAAGIDEMSSYGLMPSPPYAAVTILVQLGGSAMVITGFWRWLGALLLAAFTIAATLIADPFWHAFAAERARLLNTFIEHLGLSGGFLLVAWYNLHKFKHRGKVEWD
jgi:uncharacterized membrane protein YphA (DoxX/SURF4 family)